VRRIALFSDIHGNLPALEAGVASMDAAGIEERYCLGDLVGYGPDPAGVIERVRSMGVPTLRGNYDQGVGDRSGDCGCYYATAQEKADGAASYEFTAGRVGELDAAWLTELPGRVALDEAGVRILLVHGSPRRINEYLMPDRPEANLAKLASLADADVVCAGHVHVPYHRSLAGAGGAVVHFVNSGSVGKPKDGDARACWVELLIGEEAEVRSVARGDDAAASAGLTELWVGTRVHRAEYEVEAVAGAMVDQGLPPTLADALRRA
jgi:predicted phosphodiesterase